MTSAALAWIVDRALRIAAVGVSLGALAAVSCYLASGMADTAQFAGALQWVVIVLVPVLTAVVARNDLAGQFAAVYRSPRAVWVLLAVAIPGALLATALFYTLVLYTPPILRGYDAAAWRALIDRQLDGTRYLAAAVVAAAGAVATAAWARGQAASLS